MPMIDMTKIHKFLPKLQKKFDPDECVVLCSWLLDKIPEETIRQCLEFDRLRNKLNLIKDISKKI